VRLDPALPPLVIAATACSHLLTSPCPPPSIHAKKNTATAQVRITDIIDNTYFARIHLGRTPHPHISAAPDGPQAPPPAAAAAGASSPQAPAADDGEVDVDARPSDAINLAIRFGARMYVTQKIASSAAAPPVEPHRESAAAERGGRGGLHGFAHGGESNAEIVKSVREALASYDDPTVMFQLQKELAIKEERFEDARWVWA